MGGNPSNNQRGANPFLRLIRNSIGGGDVIRIKLLDSDDESLFGSGVSEDDYDDEENDEEAAAHSDNSSICSNEKHVLRIPHRQRPRAHSCFVNTSENFAMIQPTYQQQQQHAHAHRHHHHHHHDSHGSHQQQQHPHHVHHVEPYEHHLLGSSASSSNCDNHLQDYYDGANDDDALMVASTGHAACSRRQRALSHKREQHHQHHRRSRSRGYCGKFVLLRPIKLLTAFAMPANSTSQLKRLTACSPANLTYVCSFVLLTVFLHTIYYIAL